MRVRRLFLPALALVGLLGFLAAPASAQTHPAPVPATNASGVMLTATRFDPLTHQTLATIVINYASRPDGTFEANTTDTSSGVVTHSSQIVRGIAGSISDPASLGHAGAGKLPDASGGCCSAAGGWNVQVSVTNGPSWAPNFTYHSQLIFCWGGGIAGVRWGSVYNCGYSPYSPNFPYMSTWFTNVASLTDKNPRAAGASTYYSGWAPMGNAYNTEFVDWQEGAVDVCSFVNIGCIYTHYPQIEIVGHANGEFDYSTNSG